MKYSKRVLRAVDMFGLVLVGVGALCLLLGFMVWAPGDEYRGIVGKGRPHLLLAYFIGGLVFTCSGFALNLKLRHVQKHGGREPPDFEDSR